MSHFHDTTVRVAALLLASSLLVTGCSSSSDSSALVEDDNVIVSANDPVEVAVDDGCGSRPVSAK